jgi:hypothetical protein
MQQIQILTNELTNTKELWKTPKGDYVLLSRVDVPFVGWETMIFNCDPKGEVVDYTDLYCHRGWETPAESMKAYGQHIGESE